MLKWRGDALDNAAVDFNVAANNFKCNLFARLLGGLAHHAVQTLRQAIELNHAGA